MAKMPSFGDFMKNRGKGGPKKGVDLLGALKKAKKFKLAKKAGKNEEKEDKKESKDQEKAEKKAGEE